MPFFCVVIPVFNRGELLIETLNSVLSQRFHEYEILVVDDGSTDNTPKILVEKFGMNQKIKIIHQENKERGAARNTGFRNSTSDYVIFFDSDDLMHIDYLETLHEKIIEQNFPDFIAAKFQLKKNNKLTRSDSMALFAGLHDYHLFLNGNPLACNVCVKRNNPDLKLFEEDRAYAIKEDWMFLLQNLRHRKLYLVDKILVTMNDHEERSMNSEHNTMIEKTFLAFKWIKRKIELTDEDHRTLEAHVNYFCAIHCYADYQRNASLQYLRKAVGINGWKKKYAVLALKNFIGHRILSKLRGNNY